MEGWTCYDGLRNVIMEEGSRLTIRASLELLPVKNCSCFPENFLTRNRDARIFQGQERSHLEVETPHTVKQLRSFVSKLSKTESGTIPRCSSPFDDYFLLQTTFSNSMKDLPCRFDLNAPFQGPISAIRYCKMTQAHCGNFLPVSIVAHRRSTSCLHN